MWGFLVRATANHPKSEYLNTTTHGFGDSTFWETLIYIYVCVCGLFFHVHLLLIKPLFLDMGPGSDRLE